MLAGKREKSAADRLFRDRGRLWNVLWAGWSKSGRWVLDPRATALTTRQREPVNKPRNGIKQNHKDTSSTQNHTKGEEEHDKNRRQMSNKQ